MRVRHRDTPAIGTPGAVQVVMEASGLSEGAQMSALVARVAEAQDRDAFSRLFSHFGPRLNAYFQCLGAPSATAEELVQETMLTLWQRADSYRAERAAVSTWLFTIARNLSVDRQRRERHFEPSLEFEAAAGDDSDCPERDATRAEGESRLRRALRMLPPEQSEVLQMSYFQWCTTREIAAATGVAEGTVKSRMRLAVTRLRSLMEDA